MDAEKPALRYNFTADEWAERQRNYLAKAAALFHERQEARQPLFDALVSMLREQPELQAALRAWHEAYGADCGRDVDGEMPCCVDLILDAL